MIPKHIALRMWRSLTWSTLTTFLTITLFLPPLTDSSRASLQRLSLALQALEDMVTEQRPCERCCGGLGGAGRVLTLDVLRADVRELLRNGMSSRDLLRTVVWELYATNSFPSMQPSFLELYEEIRDTILQSDNEEIVNLHKMPENRHHIERQFPTNTRPSDSSEDESPLPDDLSSLRNLKKGTAGCHSTAEDQQATPEVHGAPTGSSIRNRMSVPQQGASHRGRLPLLSSRTTPARPPQSQPLPSTGSESASVHTLPKMGVSSPRPARPLARVGDPLPPSYPSTWLTKGRGPPPPSSRTSSGMAHNDAKPEVTSIPHTAPCCNPTRPSSHSATTSTAVTASGSDVAANRKHSLPLLEQYGRASTEAPPWLPNFPPKPAGLYVIVDITDPGVTDGGQRSIQQKVTLQPSTGVFDVLRQASLLYEMQDGGELRRKPLVFQLGRYQNKCYILMAVLGKAVTNHNYWIITVKDSSRNVLFSDICIPNQRHLVMRPGYTIYLNYRPLSTSRQVH